MFGLKIANTLLDTLVDLITSAPILAYPDFSKEFILHTDASGFGLGAILFQEDDNKVLRTVAYASRTLRPAESNYHSSKLELLALKWSVTEKFRDYLGYASNFKVFTDNNHLVYIMSTSKVNASTHRWISELSEFNFSVHYKPGVEHKAPDCLSRIPIQIDLDELEERCTEEIDKDAFRAIVAGIDVQCKNQESWRAKS